MDLFALLQLGIGPAYVWQQIVPIFTILVHIMSLFNTIFSRHDFYID